MDKVMHIKTMLGNSANALDMFVSMFGKFKKQVLWSIEGFGKLAF
jgi:hypothetical protein